MALSNTERVISRTITEPLNNSAQNTITFRSLWEGLYNNLTLNFRKEKVLSIGKSLQKKTPYQKQNLHSPEIKGKLENCNPGICNMATTYPPCVKGL